MLGLLSPPGSFNTKLLVSKVLFVFLGKSVASEEERKNRNVPAVRYLLPTHSNPALPSAQQPWIQWIPNSWVLQRPQPI